MSNEMDVKLPKKYESYTIPVLYPMLREKKQWSISTLSQKSGVGFSTIVRIEGGCSKSVVPTYTNLLAVGKTLGLTEEQILQSLYNNDVWTYILWEDINKDKPHMTIGNQLRLCRMNQKLTHQELAEKTGIAQPNISSIENDSRTILAKKMEILLAGLDMTLGEFCKLLRENTVLEQKIANQL